MLKINIKETPNPAIIKFEFPEFIAGSRDYEFNNIDQAGASPLARQLFHLPFVKSVYISQNFIGVERYNIVDWDDVKNEVAEQIEEFVNNGGKVLDIQEPKPQAVTVYGEVTPNPSTLKFVTNIRLTKSAAEFKNIDQTAASPLARELFNFPYVKEVFIDENYVSVTKYDLYNWDDVSTEMRSFIRDYIANGGTVINQQQLAEEPAQAKQQVANFDDLDPTAQRIVNILDEYVRPAVAADGGNILFDSYDTDEKRVRVILQGACNGCPSSTFTLKSGIENMLRDMLRDEQIKVEAVNP